LTLNAKSDTRPFLGKLYFTGYDPTHYGATTASMQARDALRNAGYDVLTGAIYSDAPPDIKVMQECMGIVTPELPFGPVNKWMDVEVAIAMTLGKDFYPVRGWLDRAAEFKKAEARAKWEEQETAYRARQGQPAIQNLWSEKELQGGREYKARMERAALENAQEDAYEDAKNVPEAVNLCNDMEEPPEMIVYIEVSGDGFIHASKNIWAADVKVVVEYL
jgi:hypothetical protein